MHFELLFLFCFSLHNIEEAIWLPAWSKYAKRYHKEVGENEFRIAVIAVTAIGYLITFQYFLFQAYAVSKFIYSGFILMMVLNVIFPHLASTIVLRRYAPGTLTGLFLNAPVGICIFHTEIKSQNYLIYISMAGVVISITTLVMLKLIFTKLES